MNGSTGARAPVRVLHLRDSPWVDGPGRTIMETGAHLDPARVEFHIGALVPPGPNSHPLVDAARARGIHVLEFEDVGGSGAAVVDAIVAAIDQYDINVLHSSELRSRILAQRCRGRRQVHLVTTAHGWIANNPRRKLMRLLDKMLLRRSERVILVSHAMRRLVPRWWLPDSQVHVLHNALVLSEYGDDVLGRSRRQVDPSGEITILNVGRLSAEKGQDMLLRAVHRLLPKWPGLRLRIAGIGPLEPQLRALADSLGMTNKVEFLGYVSDMPGLYLDSDLVVQSSYTEGLPNVVLEAAFLRVPLVATAVGGTDEVVSHDHSGWLIRPNLEELANGIERFLQDPQHFAEMARRAHEGVMEHFSFDARTRQLMDIYDTLIAGER